MRLIDADALKTKKVYSEERHEKVVPVAEIDWMPTVDAVPVKHGHWERVSREYAAGEGAEWYAQCSECGSIEVVYTPSYVQRYKYCPYCGAKMDGEKDDEID